MPYFPVFGGVLSKELGIDEYSMPANVLRIDSNADTEYEGEDSVGNQWLKEISEWIGSIAK